MWCWFQILQVAEIQTTIVDLENIVFGYDVLWHMYHKHKMIYKWKQSTLIDISLHVFCSVIGWFYVTHVAFALSGIVPYFTILRHIEYRVSGKFYFSYHQLNWSSNACKRGCRWTQETEERLLGFWTLIMFCNGNGQNSTLCGTKPRILSKTLSGRVCIGQTWKINEIKIKILFNLLRTHCCNVYS